MRKHRLLFSLMLMACVAVFYSCKEEEVEKPIENTQRVDALRAELRALELRVLGANEELEAAKLNQAGLEKRITELKTRYNQRVTYTLKAVNTRGEALEGVVFSIAQAGGKLSKTSDASGAVVFEDMRGGVVTGTALKDGYTVANFVSSLYKANEESGEDQNNTYALATTIPLLPAPGATNDSELFTVEGYLYANLDATDDNITDGVDPNNSTIKYDVIKDKKVKATLVLSGIPRTNNSGTNNNLIKLSYDNASYMATMDATSGKFTLKLPAHNVFGDDYPVALSFEEFTGSQVSFVPGSVTNKYNKPQTFRVSTSESRNNTNSLYGVSNSNGVITESLLPGQTVSTKFFYSESSY